MDGVHVFWIVVVLGSAIWVFFDARSLGVTEARPWVWCLATLAIWIIAFPMYLYYRNKFKRASVARSKNAQSSNDVNSMSTRARPNDNAFSDLEKLAELKQKGFITEEEFSIKKKQLLGL